MYKIPGIVRTTHQGGEPQVAQKGPGLALAHFPPGVETRTISSSFHDSFSKSAAPD